MATIPQKLKDLGFVLIKENSKTPIEPEWQKNPKNYEKTKKHIQKGGNYGVLCGHKNLVVIDADNEHQKLFNQLVKTLKDKLPDTFTVKTGGGGYHFYYYCKDVDKTILEKDGKHVGEIQSTGSQAIGPGSTHPNGNKYKVVKDKEIKQITKSKLKFFLREYLKLKPAKKYDQDLQDISLMEVIDTSNLESRGGEFYGPHPEHGSTTGMNYWVDPDKGVWHCFRHNSGGDAWYWLAVREGIITCDEAQPGRLRGDLFTEVLKAARKDNLIPEPEKPTQQESMKKGLSGFTDYIDMAEQFHEIQPIYYDKSKNWWLWNHQENRWERVDEVDIMNAIDQHVEKNTVPSTTKNQILESLKRVGRRESPKEIKDTWIQFKNKIVDVETGEHIQPRPEYFTVNPIPWELGESEETPTMDKIFKDWVGEEHVQTLYEIAAYCLLPAYPIHRVFCFTGSGMNGKSKYLELIVRFIGKENVCSTDLNQLLNSRFEPARLYKKLVCQLGETDFKELTETSMFKRLTGQDYIGFEFKNKDPFEAYNYAKILMATNSLPPTKDKTKGFYRRWCIIEFPNEFKGDKDILEEIPKEEYRNLAKKSIRILGDLLDKRKFHKEGSIGERKEKYENLSNPLQLFLKKYTVRDPNGHIFKWEFYERFKAWQEENGYRTWSKRATGMKMKEHFESGKEYSEEKDKRWRAWRGVRWKTKGELEESEEVDKSDNTDLSGMSHKSGLPVYNARARATEYNKADLPDKADKNYSHTDIWEIIEKKLEVKGKIDVEEVVTHFGERDKIDDLIERWKSEGKLFEPEPGKIQLS